MKRKISAFFLAAVMVVSCFPSAALATGETHLNSHEMQLVCKTLEHTHEASCYDTSAEPVCGLSADAHVHADNCYEHITTYACGMEEGKGHTHTTDCFTTQLICTQQENHVHTERCYEQTLSCGEEESAEHVHTDSCGITVARGKLICSLAEGESTHTHTNSCYPLICNQSEHTHTEDCYAAVRTPTFAMPTRMDEFMRIVHLDCGRKYFTKEEIKGIIDMAAQNDYTHIELAVGNNGLRFMLDDMALIVNDTAYDSTSVAAAIQAGNTAYTSDSCGELTQSEMDEIISYANGKGVEVIPLLNTPGHMNALLYAGETITGTALSYNSSGTTIDVTNETAVAFTLAVLEKYVAYFAEKGCTYFNMGADEYANDCYTSGAMGFGAIQSAGQYHKFVEYVNAAAQIVQKAGMTPMAFNDGIYFADNTSSGVFDPNIVICYWTNGWPGYTVASASTLAGKGHHIINTHDGWYYVLGRTSGPYSLSGAQNGTVNTACTSVPGSTGITPAGCMLCVWCDDPGAPYNSAEQENVRQLITNLCANNPNHFQKKEEPTVATVTDDPSGISVTALGLTEITVTVQDAVTNEDGGISKTYCIILNGGNYTGSAEVKIPYDAAFEGCKLFRGTVDGTAFDVSFENGYFVATVPHFSDVTIYGAKTTAQTINLTVGESTTVTDNSGNYGSSTVLNDGIATVVTAGKDATQESTTPATYAIVNGLTCNDLIPDNGNDQPTDYYYLKDGAYYPVYASRTSDGFLFWYEYTYTWYYSDNNGASYTQISTQTGDNTTGDPINITVYQKKSDEVTVPSAPASTTITFTGVAAGETKVTVGGVEYTVIVSRKSVDVTLYEGGSGKTYTDTAADSYQLNGTCVEVSAEATNITFTPVSLGSATVTTDTAVYHITVQEEDLSAVPSIRAELWCTNRHLPHKELDYVNINAEDVRNGAYASSFAPASISSDTTYYFWKARVIDRGMTKGGQLSNSIDNGDNECMTASPAAYDVDALKYGDGAYWFRVADTGEWKELNWKQHQDNPDQTGHQLVFYYMARYVETNLGSINTSDWGASYGTYQITFNLKLVEGENWNGATTLGTYTDGFGNGLQVITALYDPAYEVVRSEVDYVNRVTRPDGVVLEDKVYDGQITDVPAVLSGSDATVDIYIRLKETYIVTYDWLNNPAGTILPASVSGLTMDTPYTIDTTYAEGTAVTVGNYTYTFSGWYLDRGFANKADPIITIKGDVTLYGRWTRSLDIAITIVANSAQKIYNGTPLEDNSFSVQYHGQRVQPNEDGTYTIAGENLVITAMVEGSITDVGTVENKVTVHSVTGNADAYTVTTVNGTLKVTPKITVNYFVGDTNSTSLGNLVLNDDTYNVGSHIILTTDELNRHKPKNCYDGVQQGSVPYVVTSDNEQIINVVYKYMFANLTITKTGWNPIDENQSFVFKVSGTADDGTPTNLTVVLNSGNNWTVTIQNLPVGTYTVSEDAEWSWRYTGESEKQITLSASEDNTLTFANTRAKNTDGNSGWKWLNGCAWCENRWIDDSQKQDADQ